MNNPFKSFAPLQYKCHAPCLLSMITLPHCSVVFMKCHSPLPMILRSISLPNPITWTRWSLFAEFLAAPKERIIPNFLHLQPDKTGVLIHGWNIFVTFASYFIGPLHRNIKSSTTNLCIIFDQCITFDYHIGELRIRAILHPMTLEQWIHIFILVRPVQLPLDLIKSISSNGYS